MTKARNLADNALTTVSPTELGYLDGVTSGVQTQLDAKLANALVDAKGDVLTATADNTPARLAVGANDTVLTADSSTATGLKWATPVSGSMTLLSTTTLSGASVTISSISQLYKSLVILVSGVTNATANGNFYVDINGSSITSTAVTEAVVHSNVSILYLDTYDVVNRTNANNAWAIKIDNYSSTTAYKPVIFYGSYVYLTGTASRGTMGGGSVRTTSGITSLTFANNGGNLSTGTVLIYGVN